MNALTFKPWIGPNYGKSNLGKLLVIGDSHYFTDGLPTDLEGFTVAKIKELPIISAKFYDNVAAVLDADDRPGIWDKIAFANAIQEPFTSAAQVPTKDQLDSMELAIREYLEITKPEKVIVFSSRVWEHLFNKSSWGRHIGKIDDRWNIRELDYQGGTGMAIGLHHPSMRGFDTKKFGNIAEIFMAMK